MLVVPGRGGCGAWRWLECWKCTGRAYDASNVLEMLVVPGRGCGAWRWLE